MDRNGKGTNMMKVSEKGKKKKAAKMNVKACGFFHTLSPKDTWQVLSYLEIGFKSHAIKSKSLPF